MSVCGGMGGRGFEHLTGVTGGLFSLTESLCMSSAGPGVDGSMAWDRDRWEGRDFF